MVAKRRVFIVEDHPVTRQGLAILIDREEDLWVCGQAASAPQALAEIAAGQPEVVVMDIALPGRDGIECLKDIAVRHPQLPALVFSTMDEIIYAKRALQAGARGYVHKSEPVEHILQAIRCVLDGEVYLSPAMQSQLLRNGLDFGGPKSALGVDLLSNRELEIFRMIGEGSGTRQIAQNLNLSISTVETHRTHIKDKLGVARAPDLVRQAVIWLNQKNFDR